MDLEVVTFGCRINSYESELIREMLLSESQDKLPSGKCIIVNTCAVTAEASRQARQAIRKLRKNNPEAFIIATGCAVQVGATEFLKMSCIDKLLGNFDKLNKKNYFLNSPNYKVSDVSYFSDEQAFPDRVIDNFSGRSKAYVQIQQGCDNHCTYCIVPKARGKSRSCSFARIKSEAEKLTRNGFSEITLTGVDIASWTGNSEHNDEPATLSAMIKRLLQEVPEIKRLRLSSFDPAKVDDKLIDLFGEERRLMPYLHLSLQSGDDEVLRKMARRHRAKDVITLCQKLRAVRPDIVFGADVIAGFPSEDEEMYQNTINLIKKCNIFLLHVFPYSQRPMTPAALLPVASTEERSRRAALIRQEGEVLRNKYLSTLKGVKVNVLLEHPFFGLAENYIGVHTTSKGKCGDIVTVEITDIQNGELIGNIC